MCGHGGMAICQNAWLWRVPLAVCHLGNVLRSGCRCLDRHKWSFPAKAGGAMRLSLFILQAIPDRTENAAKPRFRASARHGVSRHGRMWEERCSACSPQRGNLRKRGECEIEGGKTDFWVGQEIQGEWHWSKEDKRRIYRQSTEVECMCVIQAVMRCTMHQSLLQRVLTDHVKHLNLPSKTNKDTVASSAPSTRTAMGL